MECFRCGADFASAAVERIGFRAECARCGADLHCCRNCRHHDPAAYNECRESGAERVAERDRANRCEWFQPGGRGGDPGERARAAARSDLEKLFGK